MNRKVIKLIAALVSAVLACTLFCCIFAACSSPEVAELDIVSPPDKTEYVEGEYFDATGLVVNAVYSDGTVEESVEYTVESGSALAANTSYAYVSYGGVRLAR